MTWIYSPSRYQLSSTHLFVAYDDDPERCQQLLAVLLSKIESFYHADDLENEIKESSAVDDCETSATHNWQFSTTNVNYPE